MARLLLLGVLVILIARAFWRVIDAVIEGFRGGPARRAPASKKLVRDPVCGTYVTPERAMSLPLPDGAVYFCSDACRNQYRARA
ncbi:MAG: hypothetical protein FJW23_07055 [Acidimicrobiia bacterium]|nr:hypothetical protein [Acidimicrobiia bacterium]